jgi:hypothetical protein
MKREKRLTKKERKLADGGPSGAQRTARAAQPVRAPQQHRHQHQHIHCIACGKHLDAGMFGEPDGANFIRCDHGSDFAHCVACYDKAKALVEEHDRTNTPIKKAAAWH